MTESTGPRRTVIRTPDQKLRVFVSSTLHELAAERTAARRAIESLRLSPVMFELGARPHPPRELYRAYLEQSHVFVGIYWQKYGWVAPGEEISGLEDEYRLSGRRPKLIYIKAPAPEREARLATLLKAVQADDCVSYRSFSTPEELESLLADDLALLLSESFESSLGEGSDPSEAGGPHETLPVPATSLVGRGSELEEAANALRSDEVRLLTLIGPGGIGKTRLAIAVAARLREVFPDGIAFVPLEAVRDPGAVITAIAQALDVREFDGHAIAEDVKRAIGSRRLLLVLDNFEQVVDAAPEVASLLQAAPNLKVLVTSRTALRLSAEHELTVPPLALPVGGETCSALEAAQADAVRLFVERARALRPDFRLSEENAADVAAIVERLDGLPLAIELAAAQTRVLPPRIVLQRLRNRLSVLTGGPRDLPDRQRTLRGTIEWSHQLLSPDQKRLFAHLAAFAGGATLEAIESVCERFEGVLECLQGLIDASLVRVLDADEAEPRFAMLETIREYALEQLAAGGEEDEVRERHARYFVGLAEGAAPFLRGQGEDYWFRRLEMESANIRAAVRHALAHGDASAVSRFCWALWEFWWVRGHQNEGRTWAEAALEAGSGLSALERGRVAFVAGAMALIQGDFVQMRAHTDEALPLAVAAGDEALVALLHFSPAILSLYAGDFGAARESLSEALETFRRLGNRWGTAHALQYLWLASALEGRGLADAPMLEESNAIFRAIGERSALVLGLRYLALTRLGAGDETGAASLLLEAITITLEIGNRWYLAYCLETAAAVAAAGKDLQRAVRLFAAAGALRDEVNAPLTPADERLYEPARSAFRALLAAEEIARLTGEGRSLGTRRAVSEARDVLRRAREAIAA